MKTEKFTTIADAKTYISNSGVAEWAWGGNANLNDLIKYFWRNYDSVAADFANADESDVGRKIFNNVLCDYLESVGEKIADYSLSRENLGA